MIKRFRFKLAAAVMIACGIVFVLVGKSYVSSGICVVYQKMIHGLIRPGFVPNDDCFFKKLGAVANYSVGGISFSIPREYLWLGRTRDDGPVDAIYLMFHVPDMSPGSSYGDQQGNIAVSVTHCKIGNECALDFSFLRRAKERNCVEPPRNGVEWPPSFKKISGNVDDYYYIGGLCDPGELIMCDNDTVIGPNPRCEYRFKLADGVHAEMGFRKRDVFGNTPFIQGAIDKLVSFVRDGAVTPPKTWGGK